MQILRRYLAIAALAFWLGGFTFYVSVVVPTGTKVLRSPMRQGLITREVTTWLNLAGAAALAALALDTFAGRDRSTGRFTARVLLVGLMVACQAGLFWLHRHLDAMLDVAAMDISDPEAFYLGHRVYLWIHTAQWFAGLVYIALMLASWKAEDQKGAAEGGGAQKSSAADRLGVAQSPSQPRGGTMSL